MAAFLRGQRNRGMSSDVGGTVGNSNLHLHSEGIPLGEAMTPREENDLAASIRQDRSEIYAAWVHAFGDLVEKGKKRFPGWPAIREMANPLRDDRQMKAAQSLCRNCLKVTRYSFLPPEQDDGLCSFCRLAGQGNTTVRVILDPCKTCQRPRSYWRGQGANDGSDGLCQVCRTAEIRRQRRAVAAALAVKSGIAHVVCAQCGDKARPREVAERAWALGEVALCPVCVQQIKELAGTLAS